MDSDKLTLDRQLSADIVGAYLRNNRVAPEQLGSLISTVHQILADLDKPAAEPTVKRTPAVPVRQSVQHDYVVCLECGWKGSMLKRHLTTAHGLDVAAYRAHWNLSRDHAMVAPTYSERRSGLAKQLGFGRRGRVRA
jgi:predicted transcriptional regulator